MPYEGHPIGPNRFRLDEGAILIQVYWTMSSEVDGVIKGGSCDISVLVTGPMQRGPFSANHCTYNDVEPKVGDPEFQWEGMGLTAPGTYQAFVTDKKSDVMGSVAFTVEA